MPVISNIISKILCFRQSVHESYKQDFLQELNKLEGDIANVTHAEDEAMVILHL